MGGGICGPRVNALVLDCPTTPRRALSSTLWESSVMMPLIPWYLFLWFSIDRAEYLIKICKAVLPCLSVECQDAKHVSSSMPFISLGALR